jgi:hypothetical protein
VLIELIDAKTKEHKETLEVSYIFNIFDTLIFFFWIVLAVLLLLAISLLWYNGTVHILLYYLIV